MFTRPLMTHPYQGLEHRNDAFIKDFLNLLPKD